jgi:GMP synthase (glutamine-hydrolysing)
MLKRLKGITGPEEKRKIIGNFYIDIFEDEMFKLIKKDHDVQFLLQGTIYSDVIESQGTKYASRIKSHHNVGGLPENMKLKLIEPLRELYKDEVRSLGRAIGLPEEFVMKQPFPGPGFAVRIRGEVTRERLEKEKHADKIVMEELKKSDWLSKVFISFPVMTGADSTAVKGDGKFFGEVICLRIVESKDIMTATWVRVPYDTLQRISSRIVNEVPGISRVVYDISTKPPATMEWE